MKKYLISVNQTSQGFVEVKADSDEKALCLARDEYENGNVCFCSDEEFKIERSDED